jgi:hypothetical protein
MLLLETVLPIPPQSYANLCVEFFWFLCQNEAGFEIQESYYQSAANNKMQQTPKAALVIVVAIA